MILKKLLALGIIFLFIGISVAPSIDSSVVKTSDDNNLVEVTSQACGIQGFGNTTVKLTKQQYQDLEWYLVDFRARLNQTTTREEAVPLFKDAVVELNKYGLLPKGMSVEQAQRLVTIGERLQSTLKNLKQRNPKIINIVCLFAGIFHEPSEFNIFILLGVLLADSGGYYSLFQTILGMTLYCFGFLKPLRFMNKIFFITSVDFFFSVGLGGIKKGQLDISTVNGFTGLKIELSLKQQVSFYLGFALDIE